MTRDELERFLVLLQLFVERFLDIVQAVSDDLRAPARQRGKWEVRIDRPRTLRSRRRPVESLSDDTISM